MRKYKITATPTERGGTASQQTTYVMASNENHARHEGIVNLYGANAFWWSDPTTERTGHVYRDQGGRSQKVSPHIKLEIEKVKP